MSKLAEIFENANLTKAQLEDILKTLLENPMAAMTKVTELKVSPDLIQQVMATVMMNPAEIGEFAKHLGIDAELVDKVGEKVKSAIPNGGDGEEK